MSWDVVIAPRPRARARTSPISASMPLIVSLYAGAIAGAEIVTVFAGAGAGVLCNTIVLLTLLGHYVVLDQLGAEERYDTRALPLLAILPLFSIYRWALPLHHVGLAARYVVVGVPLLVTVVLAARFVGATPLSMGLRLEPWRRQALIAGSGLPMSLLGFLLVRPYGDDVALSWHVVVFGTLAVAALSGFVEEVTFRGLLQPVFTDLFGAAGVVAASGLFALTYLSSSSAAYVAFFAVVSLLFGLSAYRTQSIVGVAVAHATVDAGILFIWPALLS